MKHNTVVSLFFQDNAALAGWRLLFGSKFENSAASFRAGGVS